MAGTGVAVHCYWNGRVKTEKNDVVYEGGNMNVIPLKLNYGTTHAGLLDKIYAATGIERKDFELNIICRYPTSSGEYKPIPIKNDDGVELMLEVSNRTGVRCVEMYLEKETSHISTAEANASTEQQMHPFSHFLTEETNSDHLGYDSLDDKIQSKKDSVGDYAASLSNFAMPSNFYVGETSSKRSNNASKGDHSKMEGRKWEELNMDCLVNVFRRVGMEPLLLDVPFVCKSWYKASLDPQCREHLIFPKYIKPDDIWDSSPLGERLMKEYQENFSVTAFIKSVVARSQRCATLLRLPICCTKEALEYASNETPSLKALGLHAHLLSKQSTIIPNLISNWKNLEMLALGSRHNMEEILAQISLHCNNFIKLYAPRIYVGEDEATAIVTSLPNLKYLVLEGSTIERENLVMVLQGCKELRHLDVRKCIGFKEDDAEILALASHIPTFMCKGSILCHYYYEESLSYKDAVDSDYYSD